jgi:hypothetical protein
MTDTIHSNFGLLVLLMSALSLKLAVRYYKLVGLRMVEKSRFNADDKQKKAFKSFRIARELMLKEQYAQAFNHLKAAEAFLSKSESSKTPFLSVLFAYQSICIFHGGIGRAPDKESLATAEKACRLAYLGQDDRAAYDALLARAGILKGLGEYERAASDLEQCLALGQSLFPPHSPKQGGALLTLAQVKEEQALLTEAIALYKQAASLSNGKEKQIAQNRLAKLSK